MKAAINSRVCDISQLKVRYGLQDTVLLTIRGHILEAVMGAKNQAGTK